MYPGHHKRRTRIDFGPSPQGPGPKEDQVEDENSRSRPAPRINAMAGFRRARTSKGAAANAATAPKHPQPHTSIGSKADAIEFVKRGSPWVKYEKSHDLRLSEEEEDMVPVAYVRDVLSDSLVIPDEKRGPTPYLVMVRSFPIHDNTEKCRMLQRIDHENIVSVREIYHHEGFFYAVFEHMPMPLSIFAGFQTYLNEIQLTSILKGLENLAAEGLEHGSLSCSNILINVAGEVKISNQELCRPRLPGDTESRDVRALGPITMELMQKYVKGGGAVGVDDLQRWPSDSLAVSFLSGTTSADSAKELLRHALFNRPWGSEYLQGIADIALVAPIRGYKLPPS